MQAQTIAEYARKLGTKVVAHGCTAAGNDQVRFEVALRTLAPELTILAPVRDQRVQAPRAAEVSGRAQAADPAVWRRLLRESRPVGRDDRRQGDADLRRQHSGSRLGAVEERVQRSRRRRRRTRSASSAACPSSLDGVQLDPVTLIEKVEAIGAKFGVGRGIHLGDTIIGTKGRVAFEAPAAEVLISAHRELEKLVMTGRQQRIKEMLCRPLRRSRPRRPAPGSGVPRHRGAVQSLRRRA